MSENVFAHLHDWTEPAHPSIIRLYDHVIQIYRELKEQQDKIDEAFDRVSSQIGFVVTTTLPVRFEVGNEGRVESANLDGAALKGTLFEKELAPFTGKLRDRKLTGVAPGSFRVYLIWYDALSLKLRRDWMEPAHVLQGLLTNIIGPAKGAAAVRPEVREPAHWFDPGIAIAIEDAVVISAIDQVYPELRLAERIAADRLAIRRIRPEVMEPVHFRDFLKERDVIGALRAAVEKQRE
jgi:hypothetical protein